MRRAMRTMWVWGLLAAAAAGCAVPSDASDELDTKAGIAEGTREAYAILHYLDEPGHDTYQALTGEAHLSSKAATAISKYVLGPNWQVGPAAKKPVNAPKDPAPKIIATMNELGAIPGVTLAAEQQLLGYLQSKGLVPDHAVDGVPLSNAEAKAILALVNMATLHALRYDVKLGPYAAADLVAARPFAAIEQLRKITSVTTSHVVKLRDFTASDAAADFVASGPSTPADFWQLKVVELPVNGAVTKAATAAGDGNYYLVPKRYKADPAALKAAFANQDAHDHLMGDLLLEPLNQAWTGHTTATATPVTQPGAFDALMAAMFDGWSPQEIADRPDLIRPLVASLFKGVTVTSATRIVRLHWDNADDTRMEGIGIIDLASGEMRVLSVDFPA